MPYDEIVGSAREDVNRRLLGGGGTERDERNEGDEEGKDEDYDN